MIILSFYSSSQWPDSPCVDAGSDTASNLNLDGRTTRTDEVGDQGIVDIGYHYPESHPRDSLTDGNEEGFESGDFSHFNWTFSGDATWRIGFDEKNSGIYSAQAGWISDSQESTLRLTLDCVSGDISFYYKISSEADYDSLIFYIDHIEQDKWSGEQDWTQVSFPVTAGTRSFRWEYVKDGSVSVGADSAWIDDIVFPMN